MKKVFKLIDLDCANCAAKMQAAIEKLDGVSSVSVNFMTQKLTLEADDARFDEILAKAADCIKKIEPDCRIKM
ncbi:MAG: heavy-metal-associated domain-containing protein [Oscillospiraceae bacterium]|nr:heavy-metal-associated domain-containing protein [Oscillospiraceae bacterium]MBQ4164817.1 heavy-metal-associated domain-containing protein [Oscillospiraceae bacterium]